MNPEIKNLESKINTNLNNDILYTRFKETRNIGYYEVQLFIGTKIHQFIFKYNYHDSFIENYNRIKLQITDIIFGG